MIDFIDRAHALLMGIQTRDDIKLVVSQALRQLAADVLEEAAKEASNYAETDHGHSNHAVMWNTSMGIRDAIRTRASEIRSGK